MAKFAFCVKSGKLAIKVVIKTVSLNSRTILKLLGLIRDVSNGQSRVNWK